MAEENVPLTPETPKPEVTPEAVPEGTPVPEVRVEAKPEQLSEKAAEKYGAILSSVKTPLPPVPQAAVEADADALTPLRDADSTVQKLVTIAETKGVAHAVAVAQKLNDLYVLDTMHDTLADELAEALTKKGLIQAE